MTESVLIFRIGSIGDTVVALPCFHRIARSFAGFRRVLVTDISGHGKAAPAESILGNGGLIDDVIRFPPPPRTIGDIERLRRRIAATGAKTLVYVADRGAMQTIRDLSFFRLCGVRTVIGAPLSRRLRRPRTDPVTGELEQEAMRLARCLSPLGPIDLDDPAMWSLDLQPDERHRAAGAVAALRAGGFVAIGIGGKDSRKDWGEANWRRLLGLLAADCPGLALAFFGAAEEAGRCMELARGWPGKTANLCGRLTPRESAAAMEHALLYLGHDCGAMHLAAAVGTRCVALFGDFNLPRWWHPVGSGHRVIHDMRGIDRISPETVHATVIEALPRMPDRAAARQDAAVAG